MGLGSSVGVPPSPPTVGASPDSAASAPTDTRGDSPCTESESVTVRVALPHPNPTMLIVAMMTKLAGMPMAERNVTSVEDTVATTSAAISGISVRSFPTVSRVRRAMVNAPRPMAPAPRMTPSPTLRVPFPTSGPTALATFDAPAENAM